MSRWKPLASPVSHDSKVQANDDEILFISDLHLDQQHTDIIDQFLNFLQTRAQDARILYILGDLFEVWLGDDDPAEAFTPIFNALHHLGQNTRLYLLHGNRDFLLGQAFAKRIGCTIIEDPTVIKLGSHRVALLHGDTLCTDDVDYQRFRQLVRAESWQQDFLDKPLAERQAVAAALRDKSAQAMNEKSVEIMDVNAQTVSETFAQLDVDILIHGHTHRPGIHSLPGGRQRIVLGDWRPQPSYLSWQQGKFTLIDPRL